MLAVAVAEVAELPFKRCERRADHVGREWVAGFRPAAVYALRALERLRYTETVMARSVARLPVVFVRVEHYTRM